MRSPTQIREWPASGRDAFRKEVLEQGEPVVMRGLVKDWPVVAQSASSPAEAARYIEGLYNGAAVTIMAGPPAIKGRLFYQEGLRALNFQTMEADLRQAMKGLIASLDKAEPPTIYMGAASVARFLPDFTRDNRLHLVDESVVPNLWLGNRVIVGPHNDIPDNIACVVAGRRRFRLFPPEQLPNLYIGPLEINPAGRPVSLVPVAEPDLTQFPRFEAALAASQETELEPGDALFIPSFWWHSVESLEPFNILVNYWWNASERDAGAGEAVLIHGLMAIARLPERQRRAWRAYFDHYVFRTGGEPVGHIPVDAQGWLGEPDPDMIDAQKNFIRKWLNT